MSDLTIYPAHHRMSVAQLEALPPGPTGRGPAPHLEQLQDWTKPVGQGQFAGHRADPPLRRTGTRSPRRFGQGTSAPSTSAKARCASRPTSLSACPGISRSCPAPSPSAIAASGERVEDYLDVEFSVPESRFNNWPTALRSQFEAARTVKPGKPSFRLTFTQEA